MHTIAARCAASATQSRSGDPSHMCDSLLIKQSHMCDRNSITHVCDIGSHMCDACVMHHTRQRRVTHCVTHVVRCQSGQRSRTPHEKRRIAKGVVHTAWMLSCRAMLCVPRWDDRQRLSEWQSVGPPGVAAASASQPVTGSTQRRPKMSRRVSILRIGARPRLFC